MPLYLVVHTVETVTATVPLGMIILTDCVKRKSLPLALKCRVVVPSSGHQSISIWDASNAEELQEWLDTNISQDFTSQINEVREDFCYGLSLELSTARAADKVVTGSRSAYQTLNATSVRVVEAASQTLQQKLEVLDQRTNIITATKEATSAVTTRVKAAKDRAMDSETMQSTLHNLQTGMQSVGSQMGRAFSWMGEKVAQTRESLLQGSAPGSSMGAAPEYEAAASAPAAYGGVAMGSSGLPTSTNPGRPSGETATAGTGTGGSWGQSQDEHNDHNSHFTLDEGAPDTPVSPLKLDEGDEKENAPAASVPTPAQAGAAGATA